MRATTAGDPRTLRPRAAGFGFNTWWRFGADAAWCFGGGGGGPVKPRAIRPVRSGVGTAGFAPVMPAQAGSDLYELVVSLPERAMAALKEDRRYMRWVDQVVD